MASPEAKAPFRQDGAFLQAIPGFRLHDRVPPCALIRVIGKLLINLCFQPLDLIIQFGLLAKAAPQTFGHALWLLWVQGLLEAFQVYVMLSFSHVQFRQFDLLFRCRDLLLMFALYWF